VDGGSPHGRRSKDITPKSKPKSLGGKGVEEGVKEFGMSFGRKT